VIGLKSKTTIQKIQMPDPQRINLQEMVKELMKDILELVKIPSTKLKRRQVVEVKETGEMIKIRLQMKLVETRKALKRRKAKMTNQKNKLNQF